MYVPEFMLGIALGITVSAVVGVVVSIAIAQIAHRKPKC